MRNNQPVTQKALHLPDDVILMSTTDVQSRLTRLAIGQGAGPGTTAPFAMECWCWHRMS